jgi:hypothetical protein
MVILRKADEAVGEALVAEEVVDEVEVVEEAQHQQEQLARVTLKSRVMLPVILTTRKRQLICQQ